MGNIQGSTSSITYGKKSHIHLEDLPFCPEVDEQKFFEYKGERFLEYRFEYNFEYN